MVGNDMPKISLGVSFDLMKSVGKKYRRSTEGITARTIMQSVYQSIKTWLWSPIALSPLRTFFWFWQSSVGSTREKLSQVKDFRSSLHPDDYEHLQFEFRNEIWWELAQRFSDSSRACHFLESFSVNILSFVFSCIFVLLLCMLFSIPNFVLW